MIGYTAIRIQDWLTANKILCKLTGLKWNEVNFRVQEWVISNPAVMFGSVSARNLRRPICVYPWTGCEWR
ncbi:hypothetical protein D915_010872 [Fasciola hepatica]|uniref:Uncharacterized protein n=1 Tax=Fasciola hepatica TaxID=6192 RepID=A0A4E0RAF0_FASHE|nr:hypothetical protein D915_010872 [Fasciola hepatica]